MHRSTEKPVITESSSLSFDWQETRSADAWLTDQPHEGWREKFNRQGYLVVENLVNEEELEPYRVLYDALLSGDVDVSAHRHDLGSHVERVTSVENICQIMWPSVYVGGLDQGPIHQRTSTIAKIILGDDMEFDFDMLISKAPHTDTCTPWHQDESYWPDLPDKRAVSCWVPMEDVCADNGCMWFIPGSHSSLRPASPVKEGHHVLTCPGSEAEGVACPLSAGSATFHHGRTCHYTRGNTTDRPRRAFITNYRPTAMVALERERGFDHAKSGLKNILDSMKGIQEKSAENEVGREENSAARRTRPQGELGLVENSAVFLEKLAAP